MVAEKRTILSEHPGFGSAEPLVSSILHFPVFRSHSLLSSPCGVCTNDGGNGRGRIHRSVYGSYGGAGRKATQLSWGLIKNLGKSTHI